MKKCAKHNQTLCWCCANAVPDRAGKRGCSWSRSGIPVTGWEAERKDIKVSDGIRTRLAESYVVTNCPQYVQDTRWVADQVKTYGKQLGSYNVCQILLAAALDTEVSEAAFGGLLALARRKGKRT